MGGLALRAGGAGAFGAACGAAVACGRAVWLVLPGGGGGGIELGVAFAGVATLLGLGTAPPVAGAGNDSNSSLRLNATI